MCETCLVLAEPDGVGLLRGGHVETEQVEEDGGHPQVLVHQADMILEIN